MERFSIKMTKVYFSKRRMRLITLLSIILSLVCVYFLFVRNIPIDFIFIPFVNNLFFVAIFFLVLVGVIFFFAINSSDKSDDGIFEFNGMGFRFFLSKENIDVSWETIEKIETSVEEWKFETKKSVFWIKFNHDQEKQKAHSILMHESKDKAVSIIDV